MQKMQARRSLREVEIGGHQHQQGERGAQGQQAVASKCCRKQHRAYRTEQPHRGGSPVGAVPGLGGEQRHRETDQCLDARRLHPQHAESGKRERDAVAQRKAGHHPRAARKTLCGEQQTEQKHDVVQPLEDVQEAERRVTAHHAKPPGRLRDLTRGKRVCRGCQQSVRDTAAIEDRGVVQGLCRDITKQSHADQRRRHRSGATELHAQHQETGKRRLRDGC